MKMTGRRSIKRASSVLLCLLLILAAADVGCAQGEYIGSMQVTNCEEWVSLRAKPDARAERIVKVPLGAIVENCSVQSNSFTYAEYDGRSGYIASEYLIPAQGKQMTLGDLRVVNCSEWINMREMPDTGAKRLAKVPLGALFEDCSAAENGFVFGRYQGQEGYISADYLSSAQEYAAQRHLADARLALSGGRQICGVVLVSASVGGSAALSRDKERLNAMIESLPDAWREIASSVPVERIVEIAGGRELYLIIPMDEAASVSINELTPGTDSARGRFERVAYNSRRGDPFLLRCNASEQPWEEGEYQPEWADVSALFDCEVNIVDSSGAGLTWYPCIKPGSGTVSTMAVTGTVLDFTDYVSE